MAKMAKNRKETGPLQWILYRNMQYQRRGIGD